MIFLSKLESNFKILDLILTDFERYMKIVKDQIKISNIEKEDFFSFAFEGCYNHKENIEVRLDLIYFFCNDFKESKIKLKPENLELLWNLFVTKANSESEKIIIYKFFGNRGSENRYNKSLNLLSRNNEFTQNIGDYLFNNILTNNNKFNFLQLTNMGFTLFEKYFIFINVKNKQINNESRKLRVLSNDIIGFNALWDLLISVNDDQVKPNYIKIVGSI